MDHLFQLDSAGYCEVNNITHNENYTYYSLLE